LTKSEKYEPVCVSKLLFWRQKCSAWQLAVRRVSQGRMIIVLFRTKFAVPHQIKPGILKLTTSRGRRNLLTVFIFVSCEEKGYYRIVSLGHQNFDCRSYCGLSRRMQGPLLTFKLDRLDLRGLDPGKVTSKAHQLKISACERSLLYTAVSTKVVPQKRKSVRDNADWYCG